MHRLTTQSLTSAAKTTVMWDSLDYVGTNVGLSLDSATGLFWSTAAVTAWYHLDVNLGITSTTTSFSSAILAVDTNDVTSQLYTTLVVDSNTVSADRFLRLSGVFPVSTGGSVSVKVTVTATSPSIVGWPYNRVSITRIA
jgi:hypothetical protein